MIASAYRTVFAYPGAWRFSAAGAIARLPMSMLGIGIILMVSGLYGSYGSAGTVTGVFIGTQAVAAPILAGLVDRHGQSRILRPAVFISLLSIAVIIAIGLVRGSTWFMIPAAVTLGLSSVSVGALVRARWSGMLRDADQLHTAYSFESVIDEVVFIVGPVAATLLATSVHPIAGLVVPMFALAIGGLWLSAQRGTEPEPHPKAHTGRRRLMLAYGGFLAVFLVFIAIGTIFGATDVTIVAVATEVGMRDVSGFILASMAVGSLLGGLLYGARRWVSATWKRFVISTTIMGAGVCAFFFTSQLWQVAVVGFVVGFVVAPTLIGGTTLAQQIAPPERLTEAFGWINTAIGIGVAAGSWIAGHIIDTSGAHAGFIVTAAAGGLAVVAGLSGIPTLARLASAPHPSRS